MQITKNSLRLHISKKKVSFKLLITRRMQSLLPYKDSIFPFPLLLYKESPTSPRILASLAVDWSELRQRMSMSCSLLASSFREFSPRRRRRMGARMPPSPSKCLRRVPKMDTMLSQQQVRILRDSLHPKIEKEKKVCEMNLCC